MYEQFYFMVAQKRMECLCFRANWTQGNINVLALLRTNKW